MSSYEIDSKLLAANRQALPNQTALSTDFITYLKRTFGWLYAADQANTSVGTAYTYADGQLPNWALLGEYDNGSASGKGRSEYIWLPLDDGQGGQSAIPVGMYRNGQFFAIHPDHLGTPRLMTNEHNIPVWQWPYSAFGNNKPTGVLKATTNPKTALTITPVLLRATAPTELNLRMPGQYADDEAGLFYNYFRNYIASQGRYSQSDLIGMAGGLNRFAYVGGNPVSFVDALGLDATTWIPGPGRSVLDGPRNGNWGGGKWSGGVGGGATGTAPPLDSGDACYMRHDGCYDSGTPKQTCDATMVKELKALPDDSTKWPLPPRPGTEGDSNRFRQGAIRIFGK